MNKIIRTICLFSNQAGFEEIQRLEEISHLLSERQFVIQTKRICLSDYHDQADQAALTESGILLGAGSLSFTEFQKVFDDFLSSDNKATNVDLTNEPITFDHVDTLFEIIRNKPDNTFRFTYGFNLPDSSPYFPSAKFGYKGFSIGLQSTDLSEGCSTLEEWFTRMETVWKEIDEILKNTEGYLGIDSSIAPLFEGKSSLVNFIKRLGMDFSRSATTDVYTKITEFIKKHNPRPIGLCGLMLPCLEDFELADEYERGNFDIERNIFLSLHSGLGIDTYPMGIDQNKDRIIEILCLVQHLSNKYKKPLAVRFVSDGKAKIGEKTDFKNQYLKDVVVRKV
ncbi:MAG TPA: DUF711 family protein [Patescibacteria group bacterium]|nr:DUF711 family protein [Patescibacteria group bacterium]